MDENLPEAVWEGDGDLVLPPSTNIDNSVNCAYEEPVSVAERFLLVTGLGTAVAIISMAHNSLLSFLLLRSRSHRSSHMLYLSLLAVCDVIVAAAYIPLMSLNLLADRFQSPVLLKAWFSYMGPMITISHIAMTASSFLIVAASFERFCVTVRPGSRHTKTIQSLRLRLVLVSIFLGIVTKFSHAFELTVSRTEACEGTMVEFNLALSDLASNPIYNSVWRLLFRNIFTILAPFFLLCFLNLRIVLHIQHARMFAGPSTTPYINIYKLTDAKRKSRVRAATRTLVLVALTYLLSNVLNVFVTLWEYFDYNSLLSFPTFYMYSVDIVSLLTILAGAVRLPIHLACQPQLRKEFRALCNGDGESGCGIEEGNGQAILALAQSALRTGEAAARAEEEESESEEEEEGAETQTPAVNDSSHLLAGLPQTIIHKSSMSS